MQQPGGPGPAYGAYPPQQQFPSAMYGQPMMGGHPGMQQQQQQPMMQAAAGYGMPTYGGGVPQQQGYPPRGPAQNYGGSF